MLPGIFVAQLSMIHHTWVMQEITLVLMSLGKLHLWHLFLYSKNVNNYLRRILSEYFGYNVFMVMNITDIDDKIIIRAREQGIEFTELARAQENDFHDDMRALKVYNSII